jgi:GNAT superfamily N-acetyltransferase
MILQSLTPAERHVQPAADARAAWVASTDARLSDPQYALFAADSDGALVGYVAGSIYPLPGMSPAQIGLIGEIVLDAHGYHGGVGRALVEALRAWFKSQGVERVAVWTPRNDAVGQAFWRSLGAGEWVEILWLK